MSSKKIGNISIKVNVVNVALLLLCVTPYTFSQRMVESSVSDRHKLPVATTSIKGEQIRVMTIDLNNRTDLMQPYWASFGYDEPNYSTTENGQKLLTQIASLGKVSKYIRVHNLLTSGDGHYALKWGSTNVYSIDKNGQVVYDWKIMDSIMDAFVNRGLIPIAEIGFMPQALSSHPEPYRHHWKPGMDYNKIYTGWSYPPKDYVKWGELVYNWVKHSVARYGAKQVKSWRWEVWNEPNIRYFQGTSEQYMKLYDYAADAVKRALPEAQVGGPASTGPKSESAGNYLRNFLTHCKEGINYATGKKGSPLDFISFHAKGSPRVINGKVQMNMTSELQDCKRGFEIVSTLGYKDLPIFITEFDPEGCAACGMATNPENAYRNGTMYSVYTAASFGALYDLAKRAGVHLDRATSWSFQFDDQPWFYGMRSIASHGIVKPVFNVFRMFSMLQGRRLMVDNPANLSLDSMVYHGVHGEKRDVGVLSSMDDKGISILLWNYYDKDSLGDSVRVQIHLKHVKIKEMHLKHYSIDQTHSNAYATWRSLGSPQKVDKQQYDALEKVSQLQLQEPSSTIQFKEGAGIIDCILPSQGVALLRLEKN